MITKTEGAIGYVDVAYALTNKIRFASILNKSGKYATPGLRGIKAAAATLPKKITGNGAFSIVEPAEGQPARLPDLDVHVRDRAVGLVEVGGAAEDDLLGRHAGQTFGPPLLFQPLPLQVQAFAFKQIKKI